MTTRRRHPFLYLSIALHAVVLALMFLYGSHEIELKLQAQQEREVGASVQLAKQARAELRVQDMQTIKSLLEQSAGHAPNGVDKGAGEDEVQFSATSLPKPPQELLKEAHALAKAIDALDKDSKAEELAKVLRIPKEKALEQVSVPLTTPASSPALASVDPEKVAEEIQQLETKAREVLKARQQELARKEDGVSVASAATQDARLQSGGDKGDETTRDGQKAVGSGDANSGMAQGQGVGGPKGNDSAKGSGANSVGGSGIGGRMVAFINRDALTSMNASQHYNRGGKEIFDLGIGSIPAISANQMSQGAGRRFGVGGEFADRMYINSWYLIGPFEGKHGRGMFSNYTYPPEQGVLLDAVYFGKGNRLLKWQYVNAPSYPLEPPDMVEDAVYYGYTELMMDVAQDLSMWIGADDDVQIWLNDRMVWVGGNVNKKWFFDKVYDPHTTLFRNFNLNEGKRLVHFKQGRNKVFFKLSNGPRGTFLSMVLTKN